MRKKNPRNTPYKSYHPVFARKLETYYMRSTALYL